MKEKNEVAINNLMGLDSSDRADAIAKLKAGSGEGGRTSYPYVPMIEVDNSKVTEEVKGREVNVLCEPCYTITTKNAADEFVTERYKPEIKGTIVMVRYTVEKKWSETDKSPYYRSFEFAPSAFRTDEQAIIIRQGGEETFRGSYAEFKETYADRYILSAIVYTLEEESNELLRFRFKGINRSAFWDYSKTFGAKDSISAHVTKFSLDTFAEGGKNYNFAVLENDCEIADVTPILKAQDELNAIFNAFKKEDVNDNVIIGVIDEPTFD